MKINSSQHTIIIREIQEIDLEELWEIAFADPKAEWRKWDGPYFNHAPYVKKDFFKHVGPNSFVQKENRWLIEVDRKIVGTVSYHFVDGDLKQWLEIGMTIYNPMYWNKGIGSKALIQWINHLFKEKADLPHIGFTTWSGNLGMMKIGEKIGMKLEGQIRQVRYWQNRYWDSIKYGILRTEWTQLSKLK